MKRKHNNEERTTEYVYSLPGRVQCSGALMDTVLTISDGPRPMKNMRPVPKHPNCADNFQREHQEYEGRDAQPDKVSWVHAHNTACPKLKDELDKRRSVATVRVTETQNKDAIQKAATNFDPNCKYCIRIKKAEEKKKQQKKEKNTPKNRRGREKRSRVTKSRKPQRRRNALAMFKNKTTGCQYLSQMIHRGTSPTASFSRFKMAGNLAAKNIENNKCSRENSEICLRNEDSRSAYTNASKKYKDTSEPSVTTYNSYMSMDHEPMVDD